MSQPTEETAIRAAFEAGDHETAATLTLNLYGNELFGFLTLQLPNKQDAREVYADFCEQFWLGIARFEWRCSMRTWAYKLARRAAVRHIESAQRAARRHTQLSSPAAQALASPPPRTTTHEHVRTDVKARFKALRRELSPEEQTLLMLRVDRGLSWSSIAEITTVEETTDAELVRREAARLRKRFQAVKERLRSLAQAEGLIPKRDD